MTPRRQPAEPSRTVTSHPSVKIGLPILLRSGKMGLVTAVPGHYDENVSIEVIGTGERVYMDFDEIEDRGRGALAEVGAAEHPLNGVIDLPQLILAMGWGRRKFDL